MIIMENVFQNYNNGFFFRVKCVENSIWTKENGKPRSDEHDQCAEFYIKQFFSPNLHFKISWLIKEKNKSMFNIIENYQESNWLVMKSG